MTVWAGVDIGNATTEVIICGDGAGLDVLATARTPTRGGKDLCEQSMVLPSSCGGSPTLGG